MVRIGVLGGIGPESTAEFYRKLIAELQRIGIRDNTDFPQIIINSIPAPEIIDHHAAREELSHYLNGLKELDSFGVDFIVMVCNTIHIYYDFLQSSINTKIIDLRNAVLRNFDGNGIKSVLVLGTRGTIESKLYEFDGIDTKIPDDSELNEISKIITSFNQGLRPDKDRLIEICDRHTADRVLLGCTEIALMLDDAEKKINTMDILVEAVINSINTVKNK